MTGLVSMVDWINGVIWSPPLVGLCLGAGLYLSIRLGFPQVRYLKEMAKLAVRVEKSEAGISPFQAFAATVGSRVGMGNVAGVATAIYFGGPGAVFWMWLIAFFGCGAAFVETVLAQAYKEKKGNGEYVGGPAYYIEKGLKIKWLAVIFALATVIGPGITMPGVHTHSIAATFEDAFGMPQLLTGLLLCSTLGIVVFGGVKRIGRVAEFLSPVMCVIYVLLTVGVCFVYFDKLPSVIAVIFKSAFGLEEAYSGIIGAMIAWGVKRGVYSNEAGQGSGAIVAAAAETSHPAKQGLVQVFSIYIDTMVICTASAFIILMTDSYSITDGSGGMIVDNLPGIQYGILYIQNGLNISYPGIWASKVLAVAVVMFVFTSLMGYYYQAEGNISYMFKDSNSALLAFRCIFILSTFSGVLIEGGVLWNMADIGVGFMAWINIIVILILSSQGVKMLRDWQKQKHDGLDPLFNPVSINIEDKTGAWSRK